MFKILPLVVLLVGCSGLPKPGVEIETQYVTKAEFHKYMKAQILEHIRLDYFIMNDLCFTEYATCRVDNKRDKKGCWAMHEQCVINAAAIFKTLTDRNK